MRWSFAFLARFVAIAAALFALWSVYGLSDAYTRLVVTASNPLVEVVTGFRVTEFVPGEQGVNLRITRGADTTILQLKPREIFSGLIPFLALMAASAGFWRPRRLASLAVGTLVLFVFHAGLLVLGPFLEGGPQGNMPREWVRPVNVIVDVVYGFYGLVGFAALPFLLWFWLGRQEPADAVGQEQGKGDPPPSATASRGGSPV